MNKRIKKLWIDALRSGKYKQGRGQLRSAGNKFCCLGVLCNLHAQEHPEVAKKQKSPRAYMGIEAFLPSEVAQWAGLSELEIKFGTVFVRNGPRKGESVINLNDDLKLSFNQIADAIEAKP